MMSIPEAQALQDLIWLLRSLHERVSAIEERVPTWASGNLPRADIAARLGRLDRAAAAINGNGLSSPADPGEREARRDAPGLAASNAQPMAPGGTLRAAIAGILKTAPEATAPLVLERLRSTHAGRLPSARTIRWHLAALRGNGNGNARLPPPGAEFPNL
jgi:hypothetical protein